MKMNPRWPTGGAWARCDARCPVATASWRCGKNHSRKYRNGSWRLAKTEEMNKHCRYMNIRLYIFRCYRMNASLFMRRPETGDTWGSVQRDADKIDGGCDRHGPAVGARAVSGLARPVRARFLYPCSLSPFGRTAEEGEHLSTYCFPNPNSEPHNTETPPSTSTNTWRNPEFSTCILNNRRQGCLSRLLTRIKPQLDIYNILVVVIMHRPTCIFWQ